MRLSSATGTMSRERKDICINYHKLMLEIATVILTNSGKKQKMPPLPEL